MIEEKKKEAETQAILASIAKDSDALLARVKRSVGAFDQLRDLLSPDGNGTLTKLGKLRRCLQSFRRGELAIPFLTEWHSSSMRLVEELKRQYPLAEVAEALHHTWNAQKSLYALLTERYDEYETDEAYWDEIGKKLDGLKTLYRENSNGFARLCAAEYEAARHRQRQGRVKSKVAAARHREEDAIYREICRRHDRKRPFAGKGPSYLKIVQAMMSEGNTYSARMRGKSAATWANRASTWALRHRSTPPA